MGVKECCLFSNLNSIDQGIVEEDGGLQEVKRTSLQCSHLLMTAKPQGSHRK